MKAETLEKYNNIIALIETGLSVPEAANKLGISVSGAYYACEKMGHKFVYTVNEIEQHHDYITEQKLAGATNQEIANALGYTKIDIREYCKKHKIKSTVDNAERFRYTDDIVVQRVKDYLGDGFEYIGGYTGETSKVKLKCKKCGTIIDRSWFTVRCQSVTCDVCARAETERKQTERREVAAQRKAEQKAEREQIKAVAVFFAQIEAEEKRLNKMHPCPVCGEQTLKPKYCSADCANKVKNKTKDIKRRSKIKHALVDTDITISGLYKRDAGICYICGKPCSFDDYVVKDGVTVCGDWYPSIDHVVPLSKGGKHSWENVRLAHRRCNYIKSDGDIPRLL